MKRRIKRRRERRWNDASRGNKRKSEGKTRVEGGMSGGEIKGEGEIGERAVREGIT